jgi:hypothetical protein
MKKNSSDGIPSNGETWSEKSTPESVGYDFSDAIYDARDRIGSTGYSKACVHSTRFLVYPTYIIFEGKNYNDNDFIKKVVNIIHPQESEET